MAAASDVDGRWLRCYHPNPDGAVQLVCLPHAGGSASYFAPFVTQVGSGAEVLAVQYPGRQDRRAEPPVTDLMRLADEVHEVLTARMDRPLALFGHSMGAVVAYEVALRLEAGGVDPVHLFVSGRPAPARRREGDLRIRDDADVLAEIAMLQGTADTLLADQEVMAMVMPALRGDYQAVEAYRHDPARRLRCPVTVLVGDHDPRATLDDARAWREHTVGPTDVRVFPGGHFYLDAQRSAVAAVVTGVLAEQGGPHA
ncbi:thioesterase II family protein [Micromonospora sp. DT31]|uniref:thioesterase II family protein n=1 Tax=Micromonospora sp. DT31 TaxID=3393434 RepID=UPI003CEBD423